MKPLFFGLMVVFVFGVKVASSYELETEETTENIFEEQTEIRAKKNRAIKKETLKPETGMIFYQRSISESGKESYSEVFVSCAEKKTLKLYDCERQFQYRSSPHPGEGKILYDLRDMVCTGKYKEEMTHYLEGRRPPRSQNLNRSTWSSGVVCITKELPINKKNQEYYDSVLAKGFVCKINEARNTKALVERSE